MSTKTELLERSGSTCELCGVSENLKVYEVPPGSKGTADDSILVCDICLEQQEIPEKADPNHWRCLNNSMWSPVPAVQVVVWRMLNHLRNEGWPLDLLDQLPLDDETLAWAKSEQENAEVPTVHVDSNGNVLQNGDSVILIKTLEVKGAPLDAKRGTAVRNITLVADNPAQIEGRVNGQLLVILTKFVKKSN